jgi:hypothetical protein
MTKPDMLHADGHMSAIVAYPGGVQLRRYAAAFAAALAGVSEHTCETVFEYNAANVSRTTPHDSSVIPLLTAPLQTANVPPKPMSLSEHVVGVVSDGDDGDGDSDTSIGPKREPLRPLPNGSDVLRKVEVRALVGADARRVLLRVAARESAFPSYFAPVPPRRDLAIAVAPALCVLASA